MKSSIHAEMIAPYIKDLGLLIESKNNRLLRGAMIALDTIAAVEPEEIFKILSKIIHVIDNGSVITINHGIGILAKLAKNNTYNDTTFPLLMEQLKKCFAKQLPVYAEKLLIAIHPSNKKIFTELINSRINEMDKDSQKSRLNKVLKHIN